MLIRADVKKKKVENLKLSLTVLEGRVPPQERANWDIISNMEPECVAGKRKQSGIFQLRRIEEPERNLWEVSGNCLLKYVDILL